jgi:hypothetical protein
MFTKSHEEMAIKMGDALEMIISCAEVSDSLMCVCACLRVCVCVCV